MKTRTSRSSGSAPGRPRRGQNSAGRVTELSHAHVPSLEAIERRRLELWVVTSVIVAAVGVAMLLSSGWDEAPILSVLPGWILRAGIVVLALAFCAYAMEKEVQLRRLTRALLDERLLTASLQNRVEELAAVMKASKAMNSVLDLEEVLDIILASSLQLLRADAGSVMLTEGRDHLRALCVHGNPAALDAKVRFGEGIAGRVAATREPLLISGDLKADRFPGAKDRSRKVRSAMCIPLLHRGELLGVLNVNAPAERTFTEHDLRALSVFAEQAAGAIANARLFKSEQEQLARFVELDRNKSEFITAINHDLRTPLTMLLGGTALARRPGLTPDQRDQFLDAVERQAQNLASMIDKLLASAEAEQRVGATLNTVDVAAMAREVAADFLTTGRKPIVHAPESCVAVGDPKSLSRVFVNLVDNAFRHGAAPVDIFVEERDGRVILAVEDTGPGIAPEHRARIFDRFFRVDPNRTRSGMGLGLSIVHSLVEGSGGTIAVEESQHGGARFVVTLEPAPAVGVPKSAAPSDADPLAQRG